MNDLKLEIVCPSGYVYNDAAYVVVIPGVEGEIGVLPNHTELVTRLKPGVISVFTDKDELLGRFFVTQGFASVSAQHVRIVVDESYNLSEFKGEEAKELLKAAEHKLSNTVDAGEVVMLKLEERVEVLKALLCAVEKHFHNYT